MDGLLVLDLCPFPQAIPSRNDTKFLDGFSIFSHLERTPLVRKHIRYHPTWAEFSYHCQPQYKNGKPHFLILDEALKILNIAAQIPVFLKMDQHTFSLKGYTVNIFGLVGHRVSMVTVQRYCSSMNALMEDINKLGSNNILLMINDI